jgi:phenylacetate-CoA ligase
MRDPYTALVSRALFPLHERLKGHGTVRMVRLLEESQWWAKDKLARVQSQRLQSFLQEAARSVPHYRRVFAGLDLDPRDIRSITDLGRLPLLDKATIRASGDAMLSETAGRVLRYNTGGSSGEPLVFYMGMGRVTHDVAAKWRATRWWDVDIGDREVVLWGSPVELGKQDRIKAWRDRILRSRLLPAFEMSDRAMDSYIDFIARYRPRMLFGYASALSRLALRAATTGRDLAHCEVRVVFATGETLYPEQRETISRVFAAPVANGYGSRDAGFIAHECPAGSLHLSAEHVLVEIVDDEGNAVAPGVAGEIVVTHLATGDFPFVRYRTGDVGILGTEPCRCGRGLPVLQQVFGRSTDFIHTPSGSVMHALALIYVVRDQPGVKAFRIEQDEDLSVEVQLVADDGMTSEVERAIVQGLRARLGGEAVVRLRRVPSIPSERSGKYRYVVSRARGRG